MTAVDMIREGFGVWADGMLGSNMYTTPIVFALMFLFGFLVTAILRSFRFPRAVVVAEPRNPISPEGREILDDANTARLFELKQKLAASDDTLKRFTETLSTTFAHLSGGLAIFDADKTLYLFNPALSDLLNLDPVWLAKRPSIADFISMLREKRHLPERRNFLEWRRLLTDLKDTGQQENYNEEWVLPDGRVFRVTGQPHPRGAIAFLFEDISAQVANERQHRHETSLNQSVLNGLQDGVVVIGPSGVATIANSAVENLLGKKVHEILVREGLSGLPHSSLKDAKSTDFWSKLRAYASAPNSIEEWEQEVTMDDGVALSAVVSTLPEGSTMVVFKANSRLSRDGLLADEGSDDPLHFNSLENMLRQREVVLDRTGFDVDCIESADAVKTRRILWYLAISVANSCRKGGVVKMSSVIEGQCTTFSCQISSSDIVEGPMDNVAGKLLGSIIDQFDERNSWAYDPESDPFTVSFKAHKPMKLSAL